MKRQTLGVRLFRLNPPFTRGGHHVRRSINAQHMGACSRNPLRQLPVAAAQVENEFAHLRVQPLQHSAGESVHKCTVPFVGLRVPGLRHRQPPRPVSAKRHL